MGTGINEKIYIKTPLGYYIADFETDKYIIEIKSQWTFDKMRDKQRDKIIWTHMNIKPVLFQVQ